MALSQEVAQQLADAYGAGDIDTVNNLLSGGVNAQDVQKFWNFDEAAMADLLGKGVAFAEPSAQQPGGRGDVVEDRASDVSAGIASLPSNLATDYTKSFGGQNYNLDKTAVDKITAQILAQGTTSKWTGEGWGSAEANARAMAENLAASGITDISQVAKKTVTIPGYDQYTGGDAGNLERVDDQTVDQIINKLTGKQLINDFAERGGTGNAFSGTYTGKGNTAYNVQFDAKGNPVFYTSGGSSNDLVNMFQDDPLLGAVAQAAAGYFGGPAGTAALNLAMGKDLKDVAKSTLLSYLGNEAFKGVTDTGAATNTFGETGANFAKDIKDVFGETGAKILGKTAGQFVGSGGQIDPVQALISGGVDAGTSAVLSQIPDFKTLDPSIQKMVTKTVSNSLKGGPNMTPEQLISSALTAGLNASKNTGGTSSNAGSTITDLTEEDIAELNPGELQAYKDKGVQGISDFRKDMKLLGSLSNSGYAGDDLGGNVAENLTNTATNADQDTLDFLESIGIKTIDDTKDSGLSNQDILDMIGVGADDTVRVTGKNNYDASQDFLTLNNPAGNTSNNYTDDLKELVITGNKNGTSLDDFIGLNNVVGNTTSDDTVLVTDKTDTTDTTKDDDVEELVVDDKKDKECAPGFHDDGTGLCVPDDDVKEDGCPEGYILDLATNQCVKLDDTKVTVPPKKVVAPKVDTTKVDTKKKTTEDLMANLGLNAPMPSQDPYANIKLMEELFGGDMAYKLRALGAPKNLASSDMDALARLLRNQNA